MFSSKEVKKIFYQLLILAFLFSLLVLIDNLWGDRFFYKKPVVNIEQGIYRVSAENYSDIFKISGSGIGIVGSGGGMRSSYLAGVLLALVDKYGLIDPDVVVGSSGGVGNMAYYVAGQYNSIENIWFNLLSTDKFISFVRFNRILDIDYLIDDVFKKQDPLDVEKIKNSEIKFFVSATDFYTGESLYFTNSDDIFEIMRASKAVPIVFNEYVEVNGGKYIDGQISSPLYKNIEKAEKEGAKKIIAIDNSDEKPLLTSWFLKTYSIFVSDQLKEVADGFYFNNGQKNNFNSNRSTVFYIKPSKDIPVFTLDNNNNRLRQSFLLGYNDVLNNKELENFLKNE